MEIQEICQNIQSQIAVMKAILTRINELGDKAGTEGMSDADYREVEELRHFASEHFRIPPIHEMDLLLKEHGQLFFEIGAD
jgi:ribosomal protein S18